MIHYDLHIRFRVDEAEPRKEMTAEAIGKTIVPFLFPRTKGRVTVLGSSLLRTDVEGRVQQ